MRAQPTFCLGRNWHVPIYSARKTLAHLGKKILLTNIDRKKWQSTSARKHDRSRSKKEASQDDADRTFPNRHHANFVHGLDWKLNSRHPSWRSPVWYFSADIEQFFFKNARWPIIFFFYGTGSFLFCCCIKNLQCSSARFFSASSTDVLFRPKLTCSHLFGQENINPPRQKNICQPTSCLFHSGNE